MLSRKNPIKRKCLIVALALPVSLSDWFDAYLHIMDKLLIICVRADPKPDNSIGIFDSQSTPANPYAHRIGRIFIPDKFELKTGMKWIAFP
jgi:hypothetical protein